MQRSEYLFTLIFLLISFAGYSQKPIDFSYSSLETTLEKAKAERKNVFIETFTPHCPPCKILDKELRNHELANYLNENFINVKVNMNGAYGKAYQQAYGVVFLPTMIFLNTDGDVLWQLDRLANANELLSICKAIINPPRREYASTVRPKVKSEQKKNSTTSSAPKTPITRPISKPVASKPATPVRTTTTNAAITKTKEAASINQVEPQKSTPAQIKKIAKPIKEEPQQELAPDDFNDDDGKILYVLGQGDGDLPPHVLRQEAYFRMQLMDGSHKETAEQYLSTQDDWLSKINMRFLHDFLDDPRSGEFNFLIANRDSFYTVLGQPLVDQTLNILVNKELERAYPRPDMERATDLYEFIGHEDAERAGELYSLHTAYETGDIELFLNRMEKLVRKEELEDHLLLYRYTSELLKSDVSKRQLKKAVSLAERALSLEPDSKEYLENLNNYGLKL